MFPQLINYQCTRYPNGQRFHHRGHASRLGCQCRAHCALPSLVQGRCQLLSEIIRLRGIRVVTALAVTFAAGDLARRTLSFVLRAALGCTVPEDKRDESINEAILSYKWIIDM